MRAFLAVGITALFTLLSPLATQAQVGPSAKVEGIPFAFSVGVSDYGLDYGSGRRMQGLAIRGGSEVFHGLGIDISARTLFMNTPSELTRMQQNTFLGGVYYDAPSIFRLRPFVRFGGGIGNIEFPSKNPSYTRDDFTVYAPSGGVEYPIVNKVFFRAEYEYQIWKDYMGNHSLNPQGGTVGVTYYVHGIHVRPHALKSTP